MIRKYYLPFFVSLRQVKTHLQILTHFLPMLLFYNPWEHQKIRGYKIETLARNALIPLYFIHSVEMLQKCEWRRLEITALCEKCSYSGYFWSEWGKIGTRKTQNTDTFTQWNLSSIFLDRMWKCHKLTVEITFTTVQIHLPLSGT